MNITAAPAWAEQMATGLALADADLRVRWVNPALAEWLGLGPRSALGQPLNFLLSEAEWMAQAQRALHESRLIEWRGAIFTKATGEVVAADLALQPFDDGLLVEVHTLAPSIAQNSPLSATLRGFAHEVKNPLAGVRGAAQLLQRRVDTDDLRGLASLIIDQTDRLTLLANRLLHHDGAAHFAPVNMHELLQRLMELLQAEPQPLQLHGDYDPSVPDVLGDAGRLQQILLNLTRNAREAGAHSLTFRSRVEHGLRLVDHAVRTALRVDVVDDGPGIPPLLRDSLFEPLVSGRPDGSGLGLALSREIAREHGGDLRCNSRPGETVFSLYLPLERRHD
ncbi:MAG: ATP-binding protein [Rhodanobacter sp.]